MMRVRNSYGAGRELPHIQKIINKRLGELGMPFKCWFTPPSTVELYCTADPRSMEFQHHASGQPTPFLPSVVLGERAARALDMQTELYEVPDAEVFEILRHLLLSGFNERRNGKYGEEAGAEASLLAWSMLEPVRREASLRRRAA